MADIVNHGIKRTDEGIVYVFGQPTATTANPAGSIRFNGSAVRTRALVATKDKEIVVFYA